LSLVGTAGFCAGRVWDFWVTRVALQGSGVVAPICRGDGGEGVRGRCS
jgi:hypothetical protein